MPYANPKVQQQAARDWMSKRRQEWLDAHPCACGSPSTSIVSTVPGGVPKGAFSARPERREVLLANTVTLCDPCRADRVSRERKATRERTLERQRAVNREYMRQRRQALRQTQTDEPDNVEPENVEAPVLPAPEKPARKPRQKKPAPLAPMDQVSELDRRIARRKWREERRARLGYGYPNEQGGDDDED